MAQLAVAPGTVAAESFEVTAGALRAGGALAWQQGLLSGRVAAETLPLPLPYLRSPEPWSLGWLAGVQGRVRLEAVHVLAGLSPVLEQAAGVLVLDEAGVRLEGVTAKLGGGGLQGALAVDFRRLPPELELSAELAGVRLGSGVFELPLDIGEGTLDGSVALRAAGSSPAAVLATLSGTLRLAVRDGVLDGVALGAIDLGGDVLSGLRGGATEFATLDLMARAAGGTVAVEQGRLLGPAGAIVVSGSIDLPGGSADLRLGLRPRTEDGDGPEIGLRLTGGFDALRRTPELADLTRWRATR